MKYIIRQKKYQYLNFECIMSQHTETHMMTIDARSDQIFSIRLRQARLALGLSQRQVGLNAGLDESVASIRITRYERGIHSPNTGMAARIAAGIGIPLPFFFTADTELAELILNASEMDELNRLLILRAIKQPATSQKRAIKK